jgi:hypothetical protein
MNKCHTKVSTILNVVATIFFYTKIREKPFLKTANSLPKDKENLYLGQQRRGMTRKLCFGKMANMKNLKR